MVLKLASEIDYSKSRPNYSHMKMIHRERCCLGYRCYCQGNAWKQESITSAKGSAYIISSKAYTSHGLSIAARHQHLAYQALFPCESHSFLGCWVYCSFTNSYFNVVRVKGICDLMYNFRKNIRVLHDDEVQFCPRHRRPCAARQKATRDFCVMLHIEDSSVSESH